MKKIIIATLNPNKIREYRQILTPLGYEAISPIEVNIPLNFVEDGQTFTDNALIKARALAKLIDAAILADDSGLEINALDGFPGLHSHRFLLGASDDEKNLEIINMMKSQQDKTAQFICVIALILPFQAPQIFKGIAPGYILDLPQGKNGFGYDPIFFSFEANAPFATLSTEEKNRYSHRGKATAQLVAYLKKNNY
ncbi:MAG: RdgB/HAM1 family non-canonical purine NTP pyrophosphatase [Bacilli bacterium]|jgi:XTP/dITP diphosphohydrolase